MHRILLCLLPITLAASALASDGVLEINQTCAIQTGCFPGDSPGLPVSISSSGSYRLTSDLQSTDPGLNGGGIGVAASDVVIDLNGFTIRGPVACTGIGAAVSCVPASADSIAIAANSGADRIVVKNGSVRGYGRGVVLISSRSHSIVGVDSSGHNSDGIAVGPHSLVRESKALGNFGTGFSCATGCIIERSVAAGNRVQGFNVNEASSIFNSQATANGLDGMECRAGSICRSNTIYQNGGYGIRAGEGSAVTGNTVLENGGSGIRCLGGNAPASISRNHIRANGTGGIGYGIECESQSTYRENTITENVTGTVSGSEVNLGDNYCAGTGVTSPSCP